MQNHFYLEQKLRRSSSLKPQDRYQDYMHYAEGCYDELDVYNFMQENNIGTQEPQFWVRKLKIHQKKCQFKIIATILKKIKANSVLTQHKDFAKLIEFEQDIICGLTKLIRTKAMGKRKAEQFSYAHPITWSGIQKKKRKIGNIQIYVDQDCRENYKLQDFSQFVQQNFKEYCQFQRNQYIHKQKNKPLSIFGENTKNIQNLFQQNKVKPTRNTFFQRKSNRFSIKTNIFTQNPQSLATPKSKINLSIIKKQKQQNQKAKSIFQKSDKQFQLFENSHPAKQKIREMILSSQSYIFDEFNQQTSISKIRQKNRKQEYNQEEVKNQNNKTIFNFEKKSEVSEQEQDFLNIVLSLQIKQAQLQLQNVGQTQTFETIDSNKQNDEFQYKLNLRKNNVSRQKLKLLDQHDLSSFDNFSSTQISSQQFYNDLQQCQNTLKQNNGFLTNKKQKNSVEIQKRTNSEKQSNKNLSFISQQKSFFYSLHKNVQDKYNFKQNKN